jgi:hypothetical protein
VYEDTDQITDSLEGRMGLSFKFLMDSLCEAWGFMILGNVEKGTQVQKIKTPLVRDKKEYHLQKHNPIEIPVRTWIK